MSIHRKLPAQLLFSKVCGYVAYVQAATRGLVAAATARGATARLMCVNLSHVSNRRVPVIIQKGHRVVFGDSFHLSHIIKALDKAAT